tara:strand:- start:1971 stop:2894 length:924 start_codon:yes stop_codon:yes gene_type:complete
MELKNYVYFLVIKILTISAIFYILSENNINYDTNKVTKINISIILLVKNNINWLRYLHHKFSIIEKNYSNLFDFEFYIFENNSDDGTKNFIDLFVKERKGKVLSIDFTEKEMSNYIFDDQISKQRGKFMSMIRNKLKDFHGKLKSDYTTIIDSDVYFDFNIFIKMIEKLHDDKIAMVTPFVTDFTDTLNGGYTHYYDTLALKTNSGYSFKKIGTICLFRECEKCRKLSKLRNLKIKDEDLLDMKGDNNNNLIDVKSAFGCFAMLRTSVYNKCRWSTDYCEHFSFCKEVKKYGSIVIATDIKITNNST